MLFGFIVNGFHGPNGRSYCSCPFRWPPTFRGFCSLDRFRSPFLGCIIKGETPHFHYISQAVSEKIASLSLATGRPVGFGIITADNGQQAIERAGGKVGNKGTEAADAVLRMLNIKYELKKSGKKTVGF